MKRILPLFGLLPLLLPARAGDLASIGGQVVNAATGEPVRKATVVVRYTDVRVAGRPMNFSTTTDQSGRFTIADLQPGACRVSAERNGFVNSEYGARKPGRSGSIVVLDQGHSTTDITVRLWPQGVITGRVVDEDGDPVRGASVVASRYRYNGPKKQLMRAGGANTNDLGEYRIFDLAPGKYYVGVDYQQQRRGPGAIDRSPNARPDDEYVTTYYPGTRDLAAAAQLDVAPGAQLRNIDLTLTKAHTVRVRGRIAGEAEGGRGFQVVLMSASGAARGTGASPNGEFEIQGVLPGSYTLVANAGRGNRANTARRALEVGSGNIDGIVLTVGPPAALTGHVRVDGQSALPAARLMVRLQPYEPGNFTFGPYPNVAVGADGSFRLEAVSADRYTVALTGLPEGYYVKSIMSANVDVLAAGLDVAGSPPPLDILVSPNAGQITGTVQNPGTQQAARGVMVVLVPQEKERHDNASFYKTVMTDASGQFTFRNLVPGGYRVYSWEDVESGSWFDPEFMQPVQGKGEAVTIREGSRESVQVTLIPAD
jgi:hypothetical protein